MKKSVKDHTIVYECDKNMSGDFSIHFQDSIRQAIESGHTQFLFNMEAVEDMDPSTLTALIVLKTYHVESVRFQVLKNDISTLVSFI